MVAVQLKWRHMRGYKLLADVFEGVNAGMRCKSKSVNHRVRPVRLYTRFDYSSISDEVER